MYSLYALLEIFAVMKSRRVKLERTSSSKERHFCLRSEGVQFESQLRHYHCIAVHYEMPTEHHGLLICLSYYSSFA